MLICSHCQSSIRSESRFCEVCGKAMAVAPLQEAASPQPTLPPASTRDPLAVPFFLSWLCIVPLCFFLPGWYPIGPLFALGLWFVRVRTLPASGRWFGWALTLLSLPFAGLFLGLALDTSVHWVARIVFGILFACACPFTLAGMVMLFRARGANRLVRLIHKKQLRSVAAVAEAMGKKRHEAVAADIQRVKKRGWLDGYELDSASGEIRFTGAGSTFSQTVSRSFFGSAFILLGTVTTAFFLFSDPAGSVDRQMTETRGWVEYQIEQMAPSHVLACAALPKEDANRILGEKFIKTVSTHTKGYSKCSYLISEGLKPGQSGDTGERFWIELDHYAVDESKVEPATRRSRNLSDLFGNLAADWAARQLQNAIKGSARALAIKDKLGPGYDVRDYGYAAVIVQRGSKAVMIQMSGAPGISAGLDLIGAPKNHTAMPAEDAIGEIAKLVLERASR